MKIWKAFLAIPIAVSASQAFAAAENWVKIGTTADHAISIDMNDFRKGIDGLVYYSDSIDGGDTYFSRAVDCRRRMMYLLGGSGSNIPDWRDKGDAISPGTAAEAELKIVCAKAGSGPLPGKWVGIGFGQSIDKDSIRRGSDGLVYFTDYGDVFHLTGSDAADCERRLIFFGVNFDGWRDRGREVAPASFAEAELNFVCANVH